MRWILLFSFILKILAQDDDDEEITVGTTIGIDLGTTYSCVGVFKDNQVEIIANDQGNRTTPSYVAFTDNERIIGNGAKSQAAQNPQNTVYDAKRLIGMKYNDSKVQSDLKHLTYTVKPSSGDKPVIHVSFKGEQKQLRERQGRAACL